MITLTNSQIVILSDLLTTTIEQKSNKLKKATGKASLFLKLEKEVLVEILSLLPCESPVVNKLAVEAAAMLIASDISTDDDVPLTKLNDEEMGDVYASDDDLKQIYGDDLDKGLGHATKSKVKSK